MDIALIREIAEIFTQNALTELEIKEGDLQIRLKKEPEQSAVPPIRAEGGASARAAGIPDMPDEFSLHTSHEVKSPMVGIFYAAPSPESEPYVQLGSRVKKGDVLCIVEAMKLMNEITSDADGEIVDICAENGQILEFGQTIFKIV